LIDADPTRIVATGLGRRFLNTTLEAFLPRLERPVRSRAAPIPLAEALR
jgi:hypothetical protein